MMQGPPPSPPLSDEGGGDDDGDGLGDACSIAVTETTDTHEDVFHSPVENESVSPRAVHAALAAPNGSNGLNGNGNGPNGQPLMPLAEAGESNPALAPLDPPKFAISLTSEGEGGTSSRGSSLRSVERPLPPFLGLQAPRRVSTGSTSSRAGSLSIVRSGRLAPQREPTSPDGTRERDAPSIVDSGEDRRDSLETQRARPSGETQRSHRSQTVGGADAQAYSSIPTARIQRRNTNPTVPSQPLIGRALTQSVSISAHTPSQSQQFDASNLPADILAQTEIIRRERLERRQKKMSLLGPPSPVINQGETVVAAEVVAVEAGPARRGTTRRKETEDAKVLVGNLVGEGHRNFVLMYNMLTGIRVAVSRCQAKIKRPITDEDYLARHKYTFDMLGNELTPSARYDFKFKDYAPWVFRDLRDEHFHLDPADYLLSLTAKYILSELGSPGKSGSFFYYSRDYRFIIKTISHSEHNFLRSILKDYHEHVRANPHTLLSRFYGLHRVKMPRGRKIHFVIMNNLFPPHRDIHETYDLKGSAWGREYPEDKAKNNPRAVLKDKNWVSRGRTLELGPEKRALLTEQLRRDMEFLKRIHVMDYSLLVGIHNMERGNRDNLRENTLAVFHPNTTTVHRKPSAAKSHAEASNIRRAVVRADPKRLLNASSQLPQDGSADRRHFLFYQDEGGMRATDELNNSMDVIYYLGVIDICTPYNAAKRIEHAWKSMTENPVTISCVDPVTYGHRFLDFLMSVMRGGDPALRPQGLEFPRGQDADSVPVGSEHDKAAHPRPIFVDTAALTSSPQIVPEGDEGEEADETQVITAVDVDIDGLEALPPTIVAVERTETPVETTDEVAAQHDIACEECSDHTRPAIVGHLKVN